MLEAGKTYQLDTYEDGVIIATIRAFDVDMGTEVYICDTNKYSFVVNIPVYDIKSFKLIK